MVVLLDVEKYLAPLIERGALAVYVSDTNGIELGFSGNESFRGVLKALVNIRSWLYLKVDFDFSNDFQSQYNIKVALEDIPAFYALVNVSDMKAVITWKNDLVLAAIFLRGEEVPSSDDLLRILDSMRNQSLIGSDKGASDYLNELKALFLQARRNVSMGDKRELIDNLTAIKALLDDSNDPRLVKYSDVLESLIKTLSRAELNEENILRVRRTLMALFRNISRNVNGD